ncbi:tyrosine-type recombinase/integrase [Desulfuromonas acetoxidans]|uniref:Phage integrase n=1 Tax=Desulfuromonas acetoxidans (strain DSM 684 / 11070) TaxID=281689 RepID=Q1JWR4_DESA6|nr:site-specific integrase [Desulfuromonas acetoxidans]EAT14730.1 phage integrase [Desulfuromonas acetoxidans DSM 684]
MDWGWLKFRPAKIERLKEDNDKIAYLAVDQVKRLVEEARLDRDPRMYPFVMIAAGTAMRKMEVLSIRKEHIDFERLLILVPKAKAGMREQPITKQLAAFLRWYVNTLPDNTPWLFPFSTSRTGHSVEVRNSFRRVVAAAGLDPDVIVRHTLRHTAITHLVQAGVDLPTVKRISGHKTLIMVERYAHQNGEPIQAAMDVLDDRYGELG